MVQRDGKTALRPMQAKSLVPLNTLHLEKIGGNVA